MNQGRIEQILKILEADPGNEVLNYTLGLEYLKIGDHNSSISPLRKAIRLKTDYSAAYRELGNALAKSGSIEEAIQVYHKGILIAEEQGDIQTAKEMRVFLKRLTKA